VEDLRNKVACSLLIAFELKNSGIYNIKVDDVRMRERLKFYGIGSKNEYMLSKYENNNSKKVTIRYMGAVAGNYYVTKIPKE